MAARGDTERQERRRDEDPRAASPGGRDMCAQGDLPTKKPLLSGYQPAKRRVKAGVARLLG
jgi:hypothetical protein